MKAKPLLFPVFFALVLGLFAECRQAKNEQLADDAPRVVNIINFIRLLEPRPVGISEDELYGTVREQILMMKQHNLPGTFLLQYDALITPRYQSLLKDSISSTTEVGGWWEITRPHVEAAGLKWRGRYPWDWHADVGFATGYTPAERERLVDVYMEKFKDIFGRYPASVGSWFIDAHTLGYMYDKYGIHASCNCKDQYGTDGYTLWGGYWNQAYYPSRKNAYMPAQTEQGQIPVPVFRMLGSDPIYQYDLGLGENGQGVITLEPACIFGGGNREWVEWFFRVMLDDPALGFNYAQTGQENSFVWRTVKNGFAIQIPLLDSLRAQGKVRIETLGESGKRFREKYPVTPPTALSALSDYKYGGHKTVWFNSRFYRVNLLWTGDRFRFRDIHFFNENMASDYLVEKGTSNQCVFTTLPFVDGFLWSTPQELAGLRIMQTDGEQASKELRFSDPLVEPLGESALRVTCQSTSGTTFTLLFTEDAISVTSDAKDANWALQLTTAPDKALPFKTLSAEAITAEQNGFVYTVSCKTGHFEAGKGTDYVFRIVPQDNTVTLNGDTTL